MQRWRKYLIESGKGFGCHEDTVFGPKGERGQGCEEKDAYVSAESFFDRFRYDRYRHYEKVIDGWVAGRRVFSVSSGRGINEMLLKEKGFDVTCSDVAIPRCYEEMKELFGEFDYRLFDLMRDTPPAGQDAILWLSSLFIFEREAVEAAFRKLADGLKPGGRLIIDVGGPEASWRTWLYHEVFLMAECYAYLLYHRLIARGEAEPWRVARLFHGHRWRNGEIVEMARKAGLEMQCMYVADYRTELNRSTFLKTERGKSGLVRRLLTALVGGVPYIRVFVFQK